MSGIEPSCARLVHLYTGDGKGKSTAAAGLCLRARGHGWRVLFCRFLKARASGEHLMLEQSGVELLGAPASVRFTWELTEAERADLIAAHGGFMEALGRRLAHYDLLVLDEVVDAVNAGFVAWETLQNLVLRRPATLEIVLTGHNPTEQMAALADYHTDFRNLRHPFEKQVAAREGIEL